MIANRSVLTASLPEQVRSLNREFDVLERMLRAFRNRPGGSEFYTAFLAAGRVIDYGHGPGTGGDDDDDDGGGSASSEGSEASSFSSEDLGSFSSSSSHFSSSSSSFHSEPFSSSSSWSSFSSAP